MLKSLRDKLAPHRHRTPEGRLALALETNRIACVVDVGANEGQTGVGLRRAGWTGDIVSFEPVARAHDAVKTLAARDPRWTLAPRMALGERDGETSLNVSVTDNWSSIRKVRDEIAAVKPKARAVTRETVPMRRLDSVLREFVPAGRRLFVKIDTQGYEREVLAGLDAVMDDICGFQIELCLVPLYEGETLYTWYFDWMNARGFELWIVEDIAFSAELGRQLQFDAVFFRRDGRP